MLNRLRTALLGWRQDWALRRLAHLLPAPDLARLYRQPRYRPLAVTFRGQPLLVPDAASFKHAATEIFVQACYSVPTQAPAPYFIDCGANIGLATLFLLHRHPGARVVAIEADPGIHAILMQNLASQGVAQQVEVVQAAVWHQPGTLTFHSEGADAGSVVAAQDRAANTIAVPAITLHQWLDRPVDLLKLDIEGAELAVLQSIAPQLPQVRHLFVEYHSLVDEPQGLSQLLGLLEDAGFRYYIAHNGPTTASPFIERPAQLGFDCLLNIFAYRPQAGL